MRIYCSITGSSGEGPTFAHNRAALESLYTQGLNWRAEIGSEEQNISCIIYTDNGHNTGDFEQAVREAYNAPNFKYVAYLASLDNNLTVSQVSAIEEPAEEDGDSDTDRTPLVIPTDSPFNVEAKKYFVFNTTGNIMMVSTNESGQMAESVREVFEEVSVFFAAMTKAITNTPNPNNKNKPYSLYNYAALEKVIGGSGLFVHITEEDISYETESFGASFGIELIEGLLGLAIGEGALSFAQSMLSSMGSSAVKVGHQSGNEKKRIANIIFICEYLLGMPAISAIVVYLDATQVTSRTDIGPCYSTTETHSSWKLHKDTYMFVTPKFIKEYSGDLDSAAGNLDYNIFVDYLKALVTGKADIVGLTTADGQKAPIQLNGTDTYYIVGANFGDNQGDSTISFGTNSQTTIQPAGWSDNLIGFTIKGDQVNTATPITLTIRGEVYTTSGVTFRGTNPLITGVIDLSTGNQPKNGILKPDTHYELRGINFGTITGIVSLSTVNSTPSSWNPTSIKFTVSGSTAVSTPSKVQINIAGTTYKSPGKYLYAPTNTSLISGIYNSSGGLAAGNLKKNTTYAIKGIGFGRTPKTMTFGDATIAPYGSSPWTDGIINFRVNGTSVTTAAKIKLTLPPTLQTPSKYTFTGGASPAGSPTITGVFTAATGGTEVQDSTALTKDRTYYIRGTNLGTTSTLTFKNPTETANITPSSSGRTTALIPFKVTGTNHISTASPIKVVIGGTPHPTSKKYKYSG